MKTLFGVIDKDCLDCINECKNQWYSEGKCTMFTPKVGKEKLKELNRDIGHSKLKIKNFCKRKGLKLSIMTAMLRGKQEFSYKYLKQLEDELYKNDWRDYVV